MSSQDQTKFTASPSKASDFVSAARMRIKRSLMVGPPADVILIAAMISASALLGPANAQQSSTLEREAPSVFDGIAGSGAGSPEISTAELRAALADARAIVLDARPYEEYAVSHIPGARTVPGKPGTTPALYVADAAEVAKGIPDKDQALILYCNGVFCGRSERSANELIKMGYRNVRRYQLGAPAWRALGGVMQVEKSALSRLLAEDKTSVLVDGRTDVRRGAHLRNAVSIPLRDASAAKDDGRLPMTDHNTRIFVVGDSGGEARAAAEAIVRDAFHNVAFFDGAIADLPELVEVE
jgi:rhodanese-related sulfurtransferase